MKYGFGLTLLTLLSLSTQAHASAWTQPEGGSYFKVSTKSLIGSTALSEEAIVQLPHTYQDHQLRLYGEWGVSQQVTAIFEATPLGITNYDSESRVYIGEMKAALRYQLALEPFVMSFQLDGGGRPSPTQALATLTVADQILEIRPVVGTLLGGASLRAGKSFGSMWVSGHAGAQFHSAESLNTALFGYLQGGWHALDSLTIDIHLSLWHSLGDLGVLNVLGSGQTRYLGVGLGATWWMTPRLGLHGGIDGVFYADHNASTPPIILGLEFR